MLQLVANTRSLLRRDSVSRQGLLCQEGGEAAGVSMTDAGVSAVMAAWCSQSARPNM